MILCSLSYISPLQLLLRFLAIVTTAAAANAYIVIPVVFVIAVFLCLRWYYLKTSRDVKRLEAICEYYYTPLYNILYRMQLPLKCTVISTARSPLYSHISATLQGLPTIRSFGKQNVAVDLFHKYQNEHSQVHNILSFFIIIIIIPFIYYYSAFAVCRDGICIS